MNRYAYVELVFIFCLVTMGIFLYYDHFPDDPFKAKYYYLWDKFKDLILVFGFTFFLSGRLKYCFIAFSIFLLFRLLWQSYEMIDERQANSVEVMTVLFGCLMAVILYIIIPWEKAIKWLNLK